MLEYLVRWALELAAVWMASAASGFLPAAASALVTMPVAEVVVDVAAQRAQDLRGLGGVDGAAAAKLTITSGFSFREARRRSGRRPPRGAFGAAPSTTPATSDARGRQRVQKWSSRRPRSRGRYRAPAPPSSRARRRGAGLSEHADPVRVALRP